VLLGSGLRVSELLNLNCAQYTGRGFSKVTAQRGRLDETDLTIRRSSVKTLSNRLAILFAFLSVQMFIANAVAQQPSPQPTQSNWAILGCADLWNKSRQRVGMTEAQLKHVQPFTEDEAERFEACQHVDPPWSNQSQAAPSVPSPYKAAPGIKLTPPTPPALRSSSARPATRNRCIDGAAPVRPSSPRTTTWRSMA